MARGNSPCLYKFQFLSFKAPAEVPFTATDRFTPDHHHSPPFMHHSMLPFVGSRPPVVHVRAPIAWRPTKIMHIQDLPKDDDFLSHLLIEKLGTGTVVPLLVHKMNPSRRLPKADPADLMNIMRRVRLHSLFVFLVL